MQFLLLYSDPATQTNADPDPQPCYRHTMEMTHFDRNTRQCVQYMRSANCGKKTTDRAHLSQSSPCSSYLTGSLLKEDFMTAFSSWRVASPATSITKLSWLAGVRPPRKAFTPDQPKRRPSKKTNYNLQVYKIHKRVRSRLFYFIKGKYRLPVTTHMYGRRIWPL